MVRRPSVPESTLLPTVLDCSRFRLRPWSLDDRDAFIRHANNRAIARNLRGLPHPFTAADADEWLRSLTAPERPPGGYAIEVDGEFAGTVEMSRGADITSLSAELGYWLGEAYWGRGIMREAVRTLTDLALAEPDIVRVFAPVFAWNVRSMRVLEANGFVREAVLRRAGFKDGTLFDRLIFARTRESEHPYVPAPEAAAPDPER